MRLRAEARLELLREVQYEEKRPGTGRRFREAVGSALKLVRRFSRAERRGLPERGRPKSKASPSPWSTAMSPMKSLSSRSPQIGGKPATGLRERSDAYVRARWNSA